MKTVLLILFILVSNITFSQFLTVDYKTVGDVEGRSYITLGHKNNTDAPMVSIYLWDLREVEMKLLLTEKWESDNWHYHSFDVSKYKSGSYRFVVGFGMHTERQIDFMVWNR